MKVEQTEANGIPVFTTVMEVSDQNTPEQKQALLTVCNTCEFKQDDRCGACGCILESLMFFKTGTCPEGKW